MKPNVFKKSRIALQRLTGTEDKYRLLGTLIEPKAHLAHTVQYIAEKDGSFYSISMILALICSKLFDKRFRVTSGTTNVGVYELEQLPVWRIDFSTTQAQRTAVFTTAKTHYEQNNHPAVLDWVAAELAFPRNDTIHDLLAYLAEQMIAMNKAKQTALESFWLDLEGVTDAATFATLRHKGKQQASLHKAVPAARAYVSAASRSSISLDTTLEWHEDTFKGFIKLLVKKISHLSDLVHVYRDHAPGVAALSQRITRTDQLIDQVVYHLYGLTPEEIAIVENTQRA